MGDKTKPSEEDFDRVIAQLAKTVDAWTTSVDAYRAGVMTGESPEELIRALDQIAKVVDDFGAGIHRAVDKLKKQMLERGPEQPNGPTKGI